MVNNIQKVTSDFETISLSEMDSVKLLDRVDCKFYFRIEKLDSVLAEMLPYYRLLEVNGKNLQHYESPYFDTENFSLYTEHQNGKMNRYKIRFRNYIDSNLCFFEMKYKNNKSRTVKYRLKTTDMLMDANVENFLIGKTPFSQHLLLNKLTVNYSRLTFVSNTNCERVTIDLSLSFKKDLKQIDFSNLVIAEVKQDKATLSSAFIRVMKEQKIKEGGISKYCLGVASLYHHVKTNLFKEKLNQIKKLIL
jgi:VTC domain